MDTVAIGETEEHSSSWYLPFTHAVNQNMFQEMKVYEEKIIKMTSAQKMRTQRSNVMESEYSTCLSCPKPWVQAQHWRGRTKEGHVGNEGREQPCPAACFTSFLAPGYLRAIADFSPPFIPVPNPDHQKCRFLDNVAKRVLVANTVKMWVTCKEEIKQCVISVMLYSCYIWCFY